MSEQTQTLITHFKEIKKRLVISIIAIIIAVVPAFFLYDAIIAIILIPFKTAFDTPPIIMTHLTEGFTMKIKLSLITALIMSSPIHLFNIVRFIFPGLKKSERKWILVILIASVILAFASLYLTYTFLLPFSIQFLTSKNLLPENINIMLHFKDNIMLLINLMILACLIFQLPILLEVLLALNVISRKQLLKSARYAIVLIVILSALVTPPDIISQLGFAIPLIFLYFLTIIIAKLFRWGES